MLTNLIGRRCTVFSDDWTPEHRKQFKGRTFTIAALTYAIGVGWYALLVDDATLAFEQFSIGFVKLHRDLEGKCQCGTPYALHGQFCSDGARYGSEKS